MAVLSFSGNESDTLFVRNAVLRMIASRARARLTDLADIEKLDFSVLVGAVSFDRLAEDQRARLLEAVYDGTEALQQDIASESGTEEPVRAGIEDKLGEILAFLACYR